MDNSGGDPSLVGPSARRTLLLFWIGYAVLILYVTTLPFELIPSTARALDRLAHVRLDVFAAPDGTRASFTDMTQNVLLFLPLGGLTLLALDWRRHLVRSIVVSGLVGLTFSAVVETVQLFTVDRVTSVNDLATNTGGALLGAAVTGVVAIAAGRALVASASSLAGYGFYPVLVWGALAAVAAWHPFDAAIDVSAIAFKVRLLAADPWQAGMPADEGVDAVRYGLLAIAVTAWLRGRGLRLSGLTAALAVSAIACGLEFSQLVFASRMPGMKDVAIGALAGCIGAVLAGGWIPWTRRAAAVLTIGCAWLATALMMLSPLAFAPEHRPFRWAPFLSYFEHTTGETISHIVELVMAFVPVGVGLACAAPRRWRLGVVVVSACALAASLEYLQGWTVDRFPDVTDAGMLTAGALTGAFVARPAWDEGENDARPRLMARSGR